MIVNYVAQKILEDVSKFYDIAADVDFSIIKSIVLMSDVYLNEGFTIKF